MSIIKRKKKGKNVRKFSPSFLRKYKGKLPIITRSSWEYMFCQWLDHNPNVLEWSSESVVIPYVDPIYNKQRRYYPDFLVKIINKNRKIVKWLVEIKPYHETNPPVYSINKSRKTLFEQESTYARNSAKWEAAKKYCDKMGWKWKILTEKQLFNK